MTGFLSRMLNPVAAAPSPGDDRYYGAIGSSGAAGVNVTVETANNFAAVYACRKVLCEDIAQLPLLTYRQRPNGGRDRDRGNPLFALLRDQPNRWMTAYEFKEMLVDHVLFRGNFYAHIRRSPGWPAGELVPIHPDRVTPEMLPDGEVRYQIKNKAGGNDRPLLADEVLHIPGLGFDGLKGVSVLTYARQSIGVALAAQEYAASMFAQGAQVTGVLQHPGELTPRAAKAIQRSWQESHAGPHNAGKVAVLEEGMTFEPISMTAEDAQFLESRVFEVTEMARWFRVQPHLIMDLTHATFSNIEHQGIEHVVYTLAPWTVKIQQRIQTSLVDDPDVYVEFLLDALLRGDTPTRYAAYASGINTGWLQRNEARERENLNPEPELDGFLVPLNAAVVGLPDIGKAVEAAGALVRAGYDPEGARVTVGLPPLAHLGHLPVTLQKDATTDPVEEQPVDTPAKPVDVAPDEQAAANEATPPPFLDNAGALIFVREAAARVVRKENARLAALAETHADDGRAWRIAVATFFAGHVEYVAKVMLCSSEAAEGYCARWRDAVSVGGVTILEISAEQRNEELFTLATKETA